MTPDFAPLLAAVLASEDSVGVAADWLEDRGLLAPANVLPAVLAHPASDGPRLLYAAACERVGERERGEFVRVQCELERLPHPNEHGTCSTCDATPGEEHQPNCRYLALRERERDLYERDGAILWDSADIPFDSGRWLFHRGFLDVLECPFAVWSAHADAILAAHPVREVRLTDRPAMTFSVADTREENDERGDRVITAFWDVRIAGERPQRCGTRLVVSQREMATYPVGVARRRRQFREEIQAAQTPEGYCRIRWPGVAFRLPMTERTSRWTYQDADWRPAADHETV